MKQLLILLVLVVCPVHAEIYKSQDESGAWVYSDRPSPNAERMKLPPLSTYTPPPQTPNSASASQGESVGVYKSMVFLEPEDDITLRDNSGVVSVVLKLDPPLKGMQGHKIQYYLDDKPYGPPVVTSSITLRNVDRGQHLLGARVIDAEDDNIFSASPVIFHIHRQSINNPNRARPRPTPKPR